MGQMANVSGAVGGRARQGMQQTQQNAEQKATRFTSAKARYAMRKAPPHLRVVSNQPASPAVHAPATPAPVVQTEPEKYIFAVAVEVTGVSRRDLCLLRDHLTIAARVASRAHATKNPAFTLHRCIDGKHLIPVEFSELPRMLPRPRT
jgi:hypothetical protein